MELRSDSYMVAWDWGGSRIEVGPWPDKTGWSRGYRMISGACYANRRGKTRELADLMMMVDFATVVLRHNVDPQVAHREFLKILDYRNRLPLDVKGATDELGY